MSNTVNLDPEELKAFAHYLSAFNANLKDETGNMLGRLKGLGDTWNDPKYREFADELERNARAYLIRFDEIAEEVINDLKGRAERAEKIHP